MIDFVGLYCTFSVLVLSLVELEAVKPHRLRTLAAIASCLITVKLFEWLKLFSKTSFYVKLVEETLLEIRSFMILLFITLLVFGMPISVMNLNRDKDSPMVTKHFNVSVVDTMIDQYLMLFGEFASLENYTGVDGLEKEFIMLFFVCATFFSTITMLNMLIAIMGDTFDRCTESREKLDIQNKLSILRDLTAVMETEDSQ